MVVSSFLIFVFIKTWGNKKVFVHRQQGYARGKGKIADTKEKGDIWWHGAMEDIWKNHSAQWDEKHPRQQISDEQKSGFWERMGSRRKEETSTEASWDRKETGRMELGPSNIYIEQKTI